MSDLKCSKCGLPMVFATANWYHVAEDGSKSVWPGKCGSGAGAVRATPDDVNPEPSESSLEDLRGEIEAQYQELCQKAQLGGAATLDELADVAGKMVKIMDAILELA